jgi:hypothetical protein
MAVYRNLAFVEIENADNGFERRRLAGAVVAYEAADHAGFNVQAEIVHGFFIAVAFGKSVDVEHEQSP